MVVRWDFHSGPAARHPSGRTPDWILLTRYVATEFNTGCRNTASAASQSELEVAREASTGLGQPESRASTVRTTTFFMAALHRSGRQIGARPHRRSIGAAWLRRPRGPAKHLQGIGRWRHNHFPAALNAACACADDLASVVIRDNAAPAFRTSISCYFNSKIILWSDIGTDHVMKYRNDLQTFGTTSGAHRFIVLNLHVAI